MKLNSQNWTASTYLSKRYTFILAAEESGNPNRLPYNDGKGWVTIGIGFNLADDTVRSRVLAKLGFGNANLIADLDKYLKGSVGDKTSNEAIRERLNEIVKQYIPGASFEFPSATPISS